MSGVIDRFVGDYWFLSNFYPSPVTFNGVVYPTVEHAYQAAKTLDPAERERIRICETPGQAKRLGRRVKLRSDWESIKIDVMATLVREKFRDPQLAKKLLDTGDCKLIEGNDWGDRIWGMVNGTGKNYLGRILMAIRADLKATQEK